MKKYRDSRYIAIVVLRPLKLLHGSEEDRGVTYSMTQYDNLTDCGWGVIVYVISCFSPHYRTMHYSAQHVLRLHIVRPSDCLSVCDVGGYGAHCLEILETNCTDN